VPSVFALVYRFVWSRSSVAGSAILLIGILHALAQVGAAASTRDPPTAATRSASARTASARAAAPPGAAGATGATGVQATPEAPDRSRSGAPGRATAVRVDVNAATAAELERVRGIGPALAGRIVAARNSGGRFRDTDDLRRRVRGIGESNLRRMLASGLVLQGPARVEPVQAAARNRVELLVGNSASKAEPKSLGRIEEVRCCQPPDAVGMPASEGASAEAVGALGPDVKRTKGQKR